MMSWEKLYHDYASDKRCRTSEILNKNKNKTLLYERHPALDRNTFNQMKTRDMSPDSRHHTDIVGTRRRRCVIKTVIYQRDPVVFTQTLIREGFKKFETETVGQIENKSMLEQRRDDTQLQKPGHLIDGHHEAVLYHLSLLMNDAIAAIKSRPKPSIVRTESHDLYLNVHSKLLTFMF